MAKDLTYDNIDDVIRDTVKADFSEIHSRLRTIEQLVKDDLAVDKKENDGDRTVEIKLDHIYADIDKLKKDILELKNLQLKMFEILQHQTQLLTALQTRR